MTKWGAAALSFAGKRPMALSGLRRSVKAADQKSPGSPLTPFLYSATITVALLVAGGFIFANRYRRMLEIESTATRLAHLEGVIMRLDEVLTMSARMATATGDPQWERRFHQYDEQLEQAIEEAMAIAPV